MIKYVWIRDKKSSQINNVYNRNKKIEPIYFASDTFIQTYIIKCINTF